MKKSPLLLLLSAAVAFLLPSVGQSQETWGPDPAFQRTPLLVTSESATGVNVLRSGKVLVHSINGYLLSGANGQRIGALIRVDPNTGTIDPTWHPDPTVTAGGSLGVAEAPDGKVYYSTQLAGEYANSTDPFICRLIRLNTDGSRDSSFNSPIFAYRARFLAVQPDGKIIVCFGGAYTNGVVPANSITLTVRLNTDGTLDSTFQSPIFQSSSTGGDNGSLFGSPVIDPQTGKIYFCGTFRFVNGQARKGIARCNPDGTLDTSFVPTGLIGGTATITGRAIVLQPGGKVILAGTSLRTAAGGTGNYYALLRFLSDGTLDTSFTLVPVSSNLTTQTRHVGTLPDGKLVTTSSTQVVRYLVDGTVDSAFTPLQLSSPYFANTGQIGGFRFDINSNTGAIYLQNPYPQYAQLGSNPVPGNITKISSDGVIDQQFRSPILNSEDFAPNVQIAPGGAVYVSGYHTAFGDAENASIVRLRADGTRDPGYSLDTLPFPDKQAAEFTLLPDGGAYVMYYSGAFTGGYSFSNLVRLSPSGAIDTSFRPSTALQDSLSLNAFDGNDRFKFLTHPVAAAPGGGVYVFFNPFGFGADAQYTVDTNGNLKPIRINPDGTEDTNMPGLGFPAGEVTRDANNMITGGSSGYLRRLAQTGDGGFLLLASVAPFPTATGDPYNYRIVKMRPDGTVDGSFATPSLQSTLSPFLNFPQLFDPVTGQVLQPPNGFYTAPDQPVSKAALLPDGSVVLSGKFQVAGQSGTFSLAKLTATGAYDGSFNPPSVANAAGPARAAVISNVRLAPDGRIWVLGRFDSIGGTPAPGVARLNPDGSLDSTFQLTGVEHYDYTNDRTDVVFADARTAYLVGTFRRPGEPVPFAVTRIVNIGPALQLTGAVSRKTHSGLGDFSIDLPLTGQSGVECRSGGADGNHTLVFTFTNNVVSGNANVTGGTGSASGAPIFSGNTMTVNLTGVSNGQTVMVTLDNVTDALSQVLPVATVSASFLLGDTNGNRSVNASDIGQTKSYSGQTTDATNFRGDVNLSGTVNASDIGLVKSRAGTSLPP